MLSPYLSSGKLQILTNYKAKNAYVNNDQVLGVQVQHRYTGDLMVLTGDTFVDANGVRRPIATNRYGVHYRHRSRNMTPGNSTHRKRQTR